VLFLIVVCFLKFTRWFLYFPTNRLASRHVREFLWRWSPCYKVEKWARVLCLVVNNSGKSKNQAYMESDAVFSTLSIETFLEILMSVILIVRRLYESEQGSFRRSLWTRSGGHVRRAKWRDSIFIAGGGYRESCLVSIAIWCSICLLFLRYNRTGFPDNRTIYFSLA